ncbi:MAG: hypothetical protein LBS33_04710, partial [Streptococcaceae bacterium]|nr:hypothetical protein [Streptococcaceae bacterium]
GDGDSLKSSGTGYQKQAFALSLGDIWKIDEVWAGAPYDIGLRVRIGDEYWLRSPGVCQDWGAAVDDGDFNDSMPTTSNLGVCPAMYVYVNNWKEDVAP